MDKINLILKLFVIFIILYSLLKTIPENNINNSDLILLICINLLIYYILSKL
jgi:hypothetical protein